MSSNSDPNTPDDNSLGRAANRYVSFQITSAIIGGILFLIILFAFFLPMFNHVNQGFPSGGQNMISPVAGSDKSSLTIDGHPATPEQQKSFDQHFNNPQSGTPK